MAIRNIKLLIEYYGVPYSGWQYQENATTIQGKIENAILKATGQKVSVAGAGRTDAGVHALGQVANFRIDHVLPETKLTAALNYYLPDDIRIKKAEEVPLEFHARRNARSRRYRYLIGNERSALYRNLRWEIVQQIDMARLQEAAALLKGRHDFSAFCVVASRKEDNHCSIEQAVWKRIGPLLSFEIRGDRFLHSMVRSLVGGMVNLAETKPDQNPRNLTLDTFRDMLTSSGEERNQFTAPARGLYLVSVRY